MRTIAVRSEAARDAAPEGDRMRTSCREASILPFGCRCACQSLAAAMTLIQTSKKRKIDSGILPESKVFEGSSRRMDPLALNMLPVERNQIHPLICLDLVRKRRNDLIPKRTHHPLLQDLPMGHHTDLPHRSRRTEMPDLFALYS
jgi:hypothetical protein